MRIVNQYGVASYELASIKMMYLEEHALQADIGKYIRILGTYGSSERAKEVFDDIHKWIDNPSRQVYHMPRQ